MSTTTPPPATKPRSRTTAPKPLVIKHWMTPSPHSIGKDQTLSTAHKLMRERGLRHLPVLDNGKLVGILSQRDLYFLESMQGVDLEVDCVEEGMTQEVYCVTPEARLEEVVAEMAEHKYGCVVVLEGTKIAGVFTTTDALDLLADCLHKKPLSAEDGRETPLSKKSG